MIVLGKGLKLKMLSTYSKENNMRSTTKIELEKMKFFVITYLTDELWEECIALNEPAINTMMDEFKDGIIARLTCQFLTHSEGEYEFDWYKSWWQELRTKILPGWWLRRYPSLREVKKKVKAVSVYPSLKLNDFEHKARMNFM